MELTNLQIFLVWIYFGWTGVNMITASNRGIRDWYPVIISLVLTPFIGSIYVLGTPAKD